MVDCRRNEAFLATAGKLIGEHREMFSEVLRRAHDTLRFHQNALMRTVAFHICPISWSLIIWEIDWFFWIWAALSLSSKRRPLGCEHHRLAVGKALSRSMGQSTAGVLRE